MTEWTRVNCWSVLFFIMPTLRNELNWIILHHLFYRFLSPAADEACQYVKGIVGKNPLLLRELNLSGHKLGDTRVNQIAALLRDKHCKLNTLMWVFYIVLHFTCIISFKFKSVWCLTGLDEDCHCYPLNFVSFSTGWKITVLQLKVVLLWLQLWNQTHHTWGSWTWVRIK